MALSKKYELLDVYNTRVPKQYHHTINNLFGGRFDI